MMFYDPFYGVFEDIASEIVLPAETVKFPVTTVKYNCAPTPKANYVNMPGVKSVIFNKEATVVYFNDGTKCIVRKSDKDEYNREHAIVYAIVKRAYGKVGPDGVVDGNGMGNMLEKIVANGYDQEAHNEAERAKKAAKQKQYQKDWGNETVKPWKYEKGYEGSRPTQYDNRDKNGRFAKKSNRNK